MNVGIIPVRLKSERFPNKLVQPLLGKPIIKHVVEHAREFNFIDKLVIATDFPEIEGYIDVEVFKMKEKVWCGSQRAYHYYLQNPQYDNYISIPADEPMLDPNEINKSYKNKSDYPIHTFYSPFYSQDKLEERSSCKIVGNDKALYFSRSVIPSSKGGNLPLDYFKRHIGIFVFTNEIMQQGDKLWSNYKGSCAQTESLEQNIFIENGFDVGLIKTKHKWWGIDLPEHIKEIEEQYGKSVK